MSRVFVASDLHLGHENMAKKRGFTTTEEHDEHIIKCWNSVVTKRDTVYCLGDLTMETSKHYHLLTRLNGLIRVVGGNHDKPKDLNALLNCVHSFSGMITYKGWILTHCPVHPKELKYRFKGNIHGHCVDKDTEILTKFGWKKYNELNINDIIYSYNPDTNVLEYDTVNKIIINSNYTGKMYDFKGKGIHMTVTDGHRIPFKNSGNIYSVQIASKFFTKYKASIFKSFNFNNLGVNLSDNLLKLYIYLAADGNITNTTLCRFSFKKQRKIEAIEEVLNFLNIKYSKNFSNGTTRINFQMPEELYTWNIKGLDTKLLNATRHQAELIKSSYKVTDGNRDLIFTSKKSEVDILQHLFVLNGFSCKVHIRIGHGFSVKAAYQLSVTDSQTQLLTNISKRFNIVENYNDLVWCIQCTNGNFIARKSGSVFLTGNCHENSLDDPRYKNVSMENIDYTPVLIETLKPI